MAERGKPLIAAATPEEFIREHGRLHQLRALGLSKSQIAAQFGCSEESVRSYLMKPLGYLPKRLRQAAPTAVEGAGEHDGKGIAVTGGLDGTSFNGDKSTCCDQKSKNVHSCEEAIS